ncbi:MAG TPA: hypothetical protein P5235_06935 [Saprospiraceae bacterium]|nr:hypothetical protein [Saprospiraceae bacterium]
MYKIKYLLVFFAFTSIAMVSCNNDDDDKTYDLSINFTANYAGQDLVLLQDYEYPSGGIVKFQKVSFYLDKLDVANQSFSDNIIQYIDFKRTDVNADVEKFSVNIDNIKENTYSGIDFLVGVNPTDNAKKPYEFTVDNPLSYASEYWDAWNSYVFAKLEGYYTTPSGTTHQFAYHIGGDQALITMNMNHSFELNKNQTLDISLDVEKVFEGETIFDIESKKTVHNEGELPYMMQLVGNMKNAFSIN